MSRTAFICALFLAALGNLLKPNCTFAEEQLKVALILPGSDSDKGWNQMAREGLDTIKEKLDARTKVITNVKSSDFYTRMSEFGSEGFNVVICHGGEFEKVAADAAKAFPKTIFIVGGCSNEIPGAVSVDFLTSDASKLVGFLAGRLSKTGKVAFVGADPVPPLQSCYDGLVDGLQLGSDSTARALPALWTNSWDSPTAAREKTETAIAAGADVIFQDVDAAARGVFQAVQDANKNGKRVYAFGCNSNQNAMASEVIVGSVVLNIQKAYLDLASKAKDGSLKPGSIKLGLEGQYVDLVINDKNPAITDDLRKQVDEMRKKLLEGKKRTQ